MLRIVIVILALLAVPAEARRVALVVGQTAYPGGRSAVKGLPRLDNPAADATRVAALFQKHGFEIVGCGGPTGSPCLDLAKDQFDEALTAFRKQASGADTALVFFAGHGMATPEGNILAPTDARIDCQTGAVSRGVLIEALLHGRPRPTHPRRRGPRQASTSAMAPH